MTVYYFYLFIEYLYLFYFLIKPFTHREPDDVVLQQDVLLVELLFASWYPALLYRRVEARAGSRTWKSPFGSYDGTLLHLCPIIENINQIFTILLCECITKVLHP